MNVIGIVAEYNPFIQDTCTMRKNQERLSVTVSNAP